MPKLMEKSPPSREAEEWIKNNKSKFKNEYGKDWQRVLYSTAWKRFGKKKNVNETNFKLDVDDYHDDNEIGRDQEDMSVKRAKAYLDSFPKGILEHETLDAFIYKRTDGKYYIYSYVDEPKNREWIWNKDIENLKNGVRGDQIEHYWEYEGDPSYRLNKHGENWFEKLRTGQIDESLMEHDNPEQYISPWRKRGFTIDISDYVPINNDNSLGKIFKVNKDDFYVEIKEPQTGVYITSSDDKKYDSFDDAMNASIGDEFPDSYVTESINRMKHLANLKPLNESATTIPSTIIPTVHSDIRAMMEKLSDIEKEDSDNEEETDDK